MRRLNNVGDTIIEVLLAIAIIGLTIGGAYSIASRSLKSARQAQERGEALKIAEGQLEAIKALSKGDSGSDIFKENTVFCISGTSVTTGFGAGWGSIKLLDDDALGAEYPGGCIQNTLYHVAVDATALDQGDPQRWQFKTTVRWFSLGNNLKDEVKLEYRTYR